MFDAEGFVTMMKATQPSAKVYQELLVVSRIGHTQWKESMQEELKEEP